MTARPISPLRTDPARDVRRLAIYFATIAVVYIAAVAAFWNTEAKEGMVLVVMFAPTAGAVMARYLGPGVIRWGRPTWWIVGGLIPTLVVFLAYGLGSLVGLVAVSTPLLVKSLIWSPLGIAAACIAAFGEELGWRGFMWPLLRGRMSFLRSALVSGAVWWLFHLPLVLFGWYGTHFGLIAFTLAIAGVTLFIGVLTDRSQSVWPAVLVHGAWNALVATGFAVATLSGYRTPAITGSTVWVGEFGWLAGVSALLLGIAAAIWHLRAPAM